MPHLATTTTALPVPYLGKPPVKPRTVAASAARPGRTTPAQLPAPQAESGKGAERPRGRNGRVAGPAAQPAADAPVSGPAEAAPAVASAAAPGTSPDPQATDDRWATIAVGDVVLATEGPREGWYEAVVQDVKPPHRVDLKWRDWPDEPVFFRPRDELAMLPPGYTDKPGKRA
jgi:hypothetical protein